MTLKTLENELVQYTSIIFLQDSEADEPMKILEQDGQDACLEHLREWDYGGSDEVALKAPWGANDHLFQIFNYVVNYNSGLSYIGLTRVKILNEDILFEEVLESLTIKELRDAIYEATNGYQSIMEELKAELMPKINARALEA